MNTEIQSETHTIRLHCRFIPELGRLFRWIRNDGNPVSPIFTTMEAAYLCRDKIPLLTDQEWKDRRDDIPKNPLPNLPEWD